MIEKFLHRFHIPVPREEAKRRFIHRAHGFILSSECPWMREAVWHRVVENVASDIFCGASPNQNRLQM
jgi:hypothetical protein